ncbi:MAG: 30S ribosomal protein S20 [Desulfovibrio sp.]|nr:30S ribosomal protein S20 [Desulfovibrio sp.]
MANHKSAVKRHKQSRKRAARNRSARTRARNVVKAVRVALLEKNQDRAAEALVTATSILDRTAGKGVIHWKNAARKISRLARAVNAARAEQSSS